jgi:hypothetical protein
MIATATAIPMPAAAPALREEPLFLVIVCVLPGALAATLEGEEPVVLLASG